MVACVPPIMLVSPGHRGRRSSRASGCCYRIERPIARLIVLQLRDKRAHHHLRLARKQSLGMDVARVEDERDRHEFVKRAPPRTPRRASEILSETPARVKGQTIGCHMLAADQGLEPGERGQRRYRV